MERPHPTVRRTSFAHLPHPNLIQSDRQPQLGLRVLWLKLQHLLHCLDSKLGLMPLRATQKSGLRAEFGGASKGAHTG
jgi:hypothetical protein